MESINPFIEGRKKIIELEINKDKITQDLNAIERALKKKSDMLIDSKKNHIASYEQQIYEIKLSCNHINEDGSKAMSLTHKDILIPMPNMDSYRVVHFCELCGAQFEGDIIKVDPIKTTPNSFEMYQYKVDEDDNIIVDDNLTFDPNFDANTFMAETLRFFTDPGFGK
jgi:hypothetical protein